MALANLQPVDPGDKDIDSFCFQTVGHNVIEVMRRVFSVCRMRAQL